MFKTLCHFLQLVLKMDCHNGKLCPWNNRVVQSAIQLVNKDLGHCISVVNSKCPYEKYDQLNHIYPKPPRSKLGTPLLCVTTPLCQPCRGHLGMWNPASSSSSSASWASSSASQQQCDRCLPFFHGIYDIQIQLADVALW